MNALKILGDWGTTRLRLYRVQEGQVVDQAEGPGIGALPGTPADALIETLARWAEPHAQVEVTLCGMAGSRNGIAEAPYVRCPSDVAAWRAGALRTRIGDIELTIAAGLACANFAGAPDVMRGEETQIFGALALDETLAEGASLFVLPGTHSKWARTQDGSVSSFHTYPTGELFALLSDHSVLTRASADESPEDEPLGFDAGLHRAAADPDLLGSLFTARSAQLLDAKSRGWATGFISGLLIGHEVAAADMAASVALIGAPELTARYSQALAARNIDHSIQSGQRCALAGLALPS